MDENHEFDTAKAEKANAIANFRRVLNVAKLIRLLKTFVALALISYSSTRLPSAVKLCREYLNHHVVFVIGNAIILALCVLSRNVDGTAGNDSSASAADIVWDDYHNCRTTDNNVAAVTAAAYIFSEKYHNCSKTDHYAVTETGATISENELSPLPTKSVAEERIADDWQIVYFENTVSIMKTESEEEEEEEAAIETAKKQISRFQRTQSEKLKRNIISLGNSMIKEAVIKFLDNNSPKTMGIADLGCSSRPNTFLVVSEIINTINATSHQMDRPLPELMVYLNDLPGNAFNNIFMSLSSFYDKREQERGIGSDHCFISGMPGSFYRRLFPNKSLHFIHSSSSLHRLSQVPLALSIDASVPLNKGKLFISKTSPVNVFEAYREQWENDFSLFLKLRAQEIIGGGRMVLSFMGRKYQDPCGYYGNWCQANLVANATMSIAKNVFVEEDKIDSWNVPYYNPCPEEVKLEVVKEGSFIMDRLEMSEVDWVARNENVVEGLSMGQKIAKANRATIDPLFVGHFGGGIMDELFNRYGQLVDDHLSKTTEPELPNLVISLVRKD